MTEQEIIGDMKQFFIVYDGSFIVDFYNEQIEDLPRVIKDMTGTARFELIGDDKKILSIQKGSADEDSSKDWYLVGFLEGSFSDEVNQEITDGLLKRITQAEFLLKYRELEEE